MCIMSFSQFYYKIMRKPYMCSIIGSFGSDCGLIILFQLNGSKAGLFESKLFWVNQYDPPLKCSYWKKN